MVPGKAVTTLGTSGVGWNQPVDLLCFRHRPFSARSFLSDEHVILFIPQSPLQESVAQPPRHRHAPTGVTSDNPEGETNSTASHLLLLICAQKVKPQCERISFLHLLETLFTSRFSPVTQQPTLAQGRMAPPALHGTLYPLLK